MISALSHRKDEIVNELELICQAALFAAQRHQGQKRRGEMDTPYLNHLAEVAAYAALETKGCDAALIAACWLHDTIEDTATTRQELEEYFGSEITGLVLEATDDMNLPEAERRRIQEDEAPHKSTRAKILKIADKLSNVRKMTEDPSAAWSPQQCLDYAEWAERVVSGLRGKAPVLEAKFDTAMTLARRRFAP